MAVLTLAGIADEAAPDLARQLEVHEQLGWKAVELRSLGGTNICDLDEPAFEAAARLIRARAFAVPCLASGIANWNRPIRGDFSRDTAELRRAAPRMRRLGTPFLRIMSWPNAGLAEAAWRAEALRRLRELARIASGEEVTLAVENCSGWASSSPASLREALEQVGSPRLRVLFDTGNAAADGWEQEDSWRFYEAARPWIAHVHVKDCLRGARAAGGAGGQVVYTWPGEGQGLVREVLADLIAAGYGGAVSIEPHISGQIHLGAAGGEAANAREVYLSYGRRTQALLEEIAGQAV